MATVLRGDLKQTEPDKPWYLWFCPGVNHAPQEYIDKYKGVFDDGYEAYREWVLLRMIERGIPPEGTELTPINPMTEGTYTPGEAVRPWDSLNADEKRPFCRLGTPDTYNHYPTGWATGFSAPYRMFKRYTYQGGVCDPLVVHWPAGISAQGEVREQYYHSTDIVPTILDVCGVEFPAVVNGATQAPLSGVSMRSSFADAATPTEKVTQSYEMFGSRGIWHQGWKAVTEHGPISGISNFEADRWQLFHTDIDRSEAHDVADQYPETLEELTALWMSEAWPTTCCRSTTCRSPARISRRS